MEDGRGLSDTLVRPGAPDLNVWPCGGGSEWSSDSSTKVYSCSGSDRRWNHIDDETTYSWGLTDFPSSWDTSFRPDSPTLASLLSGVRPVYGRQRLHCASSTGTSAQTLPL